MLTKSKYNINSSTFEHGWKPFTQEGKSINNRSSVKHDIISHTDNKYAPVITLGLMDKRVTNMKKGLGEYGDLRRVTSINTNKEFVAAYDSDNNAFKRKDGIFSHLYDAAHRFGETKPFKASRT